MKRYLLLIGIFASCCGMIACGTTNKLTSRVIPPSFTVTINADGNVNPDINGRTSPVQVKIYELSSRTTFDNLDFERLFYEGDTLLSENLLSKAMYIVQPNQTLKHKIKPNKKVRYVAVIAAYRNIDKVRWRHLYRVKPHSRYKRSLTLTNNGIEGGNSVAKRDNSKTPKKQANTAERGSDVAGDVIGNVDDSLGDKVGEVIDGAADAAEEQAKGAAKQRASDTIGRKLGL